MAGKLVDIAGRATSTPRLRGHLPRGGARPDQAQGQGRGDRPAAQEEPEHGDDLAGSARGEPRGGALMAAPALERLAVASGSSTCPVQLVQRGARPRPHFHQLHAKDKRADRAAPLLLGGGRRGRLGGGRPRLRPRRQAGRADRRGARLGRSRARRARSRSSRSSSSRTSTRSTSTTPTSWFRPARAEGTLRAYRLLVEVDGDDRAGGARPVRDAHQGVPRAAIRARDGALALTTHAVRRRGAPDRRRSRPAGKKPTKQAARPGGRRDRGAVDRLGPRAPTRTATASASRR